MIRSARAIKVNYNSGRSLNMKKKEMNFTRILKQDENPERIEVEDQILAIVLRKNLNSQGVKFFTPEDFPFQVALHMHGKGTVIAPHIHKPHRRVVERTQEMLHIQKGAVEVEIYDNSGNRVRKCTLNEGDTILFADGGHGLKVLEACRIVEVKQGPYMGFDKDKEVLK